MGFLDFLIGSLKILVGKWKEWKKLEKSPMNLKFSPKILQYFIIGFQIFAKKSCTYEGFMK